ncbi:SAM domain-containing protein [Elioraea rosea]|uniref:SAM domain-containing protein n=1 Tax=Elioraea rosea TaxID=2492390 RepID=UPI0011844E67
MKALPVLLTTEDMRDLGVSSVGHRRRMLESVKAIRGGLDPGTNTGKPKQRLAKASGAKSR